MIRKWFGETARHLVLTEVTSMSSKWRFGCGEKYEAYYANKMRMVECGSTSPTGYPWQCEDCYDEEEGVCYGISLSSSFYRQDAAEHGERIEEEY